MTFCAVLAHLSRVAAGAFESFEIQGDEGGAHGFDLVGAGWPHIVCGYLRADALGCCDRLQPGHAGAEYQHLSWLDGPRGGHKEREEGRKAVGSDQGRAVPGDQCLRGECVHGLRARNTWQQVKGQAGRTGITQSLDCLGVLGWRQERDAHSAPAKTRGAPVVEGSNAGHYVSTGNLFGECGLVEHLSSGLGVGGVIREGFGARSGLNSYIEAELGEFANDARHHRDALLSRPRFSRNNDLHAQSSLSDGERARRLLAAPSSGESLAGSAEFAPSTAPADGPDGQP